MVSINNQEDYHYNKLIETPLTDSNFSYKLLTILFYLFNVTSMIILAIGLTMNYPHLFILQGIMLMLVFALVSHFKSNRIFKMISGIVLIIIGILLNFVGFAIIHFSKTTHPESIMNIEIKFCVLCILVPGTLEVFSGLFLLYEYKNYIKIKNYD